MWAFIQFCVMSTCQYTCTIGITEIKSATLLGGKASPVDTPSNSSQNDRVTQDRWLKI